MRKMAVVLILSVLPILPVRADAPPPKYDVTPLTQADVDFYLSIKRSGADCVLHASGQDKAALDLMRKYHGVLPAPAMPQINGTPTAAQMAEIQANMSKISAQATYNSQIMARAAALSSCDETIAQKRGVKPHYDEIRAAIEQAVPMFDAAGVASCGGNDCLTTKPTPAQLALWKKEDSVLQADRALLKPYAAEIRKLQKTLYSAMGQDSGL